MLLWHIFFFFYVSSMLNPFFKLFFPPILAFSCLFFYFRHFAFFFLENRTFTLDTASGMWERRPASASWQFSPFDNHLPFSTRVLLALFFPTSQPLSTALDLLPRERAILSSRIASCVRYRVSFPFPFPKKIHGKNLDKFSRWERKRENLTTFVQ